MTILPSFPQNTLSISTSATVRSPMGLTCEMSLFPFIDTEKSERFVPVEVWQLFGQDSFTLLELLQLLSISGTIVYYTVSAIYMILF